MDPMFLPDISQPPDLRQTEDGQAKKTYSVSSTVPGLTFIINTFKMLPA
jgi:hypothetical protein